MYCVQEVHYDLENWLRSPKWNENSVEVITVEKNPTTSLVPGKELTVFRRVRNVLLYIYFQYMLKFSKACVWFLMTHVMFKKDWTSTDRQNTTCTRPFLTCDPEKRSWSSYLVWKGRAKLRLQPDKVCFELLLNTHQSQGQLNIQHPS